MLLSSSDRRNSNTDDESIHSNSNSSSRSGSSLSFSSIIDNLDLLASYDNTIKSFCPNILLNDINNNGVESHSIYFNGVCMLADISGFTKLSNELGSNGGNGLDRLRKAISTFLSKFIYIVYSYGGDVLSFAGDALICVFVDKPGYSPCESKRRAVECGYKLKEHSTERLSAHIAITYGEMCFAVLGGYMNNWVYVLNGSCVQELSQCIEEASSKQLVVSRYFFETIPEYFKSQIDITILESGNVLVNTVIAETAGPMEESTCLADRFDISSSLNSDFTVSILGFLPTTVVSSMSAGSYRNISELRVVTTMFLKLDSYSPTKNNDLLTLQPFFNMAQEAIFLSGGVLRQFLVDDKGCVLIALWGVPSASYANNTYRALLCATTISTKAKMLEHSTSIGITTGQCFCGTIGSILRRDYVAMGDSVNMAARLMSKAHGKILIDEATHSSLPLSIKGQLIQTKSLMLKGRDTPLTPYTFRQLDDDVDEFDGNENSSSNNTSNESFSLSLFSLNSIQSNGSKRLLGSQLSSSSSSTLSSISSDDHVFLTPSQPRIRQKFTRGKRKNSLTGVSELTSGENGSPMTIADPEETIVPDGHGGAIITGEQFVNSNLPEMAMKSNLDSAIECTLVDHIKKLIQLQSNIMRKELRERKNKNNNANNNNNTPNNNNNQINSGSQHKCHLQKDEFPLMRYVVVRGKQGTGKTEVTRYFRKLSLQYKVRCFYIKADEDDLAVEYGVFRKLFYALVGHNTAKTVGEFQRCIISLLRITYPDYADKCLIHYKFPIVKDILGLTWDLEVVNGIITGVAEKASVIRALRGGKVCYLSLYKHSTTMSEIIRTLLMNIPSTIIIDDAHYCDPLTWRELSFITSARLPLVALLTMKPPLLSEIELIDSIELETKSNHHNNNNNNNHHHHHNHNNHNNNNQRNLSNEKTMVKMKPMSKYGSTIRRFFRNAYRVHPGNEDKNNNNSNNNDKEEQTLRSLATSKKYAPICGAASVCEHLATNNPNGTLLTIGNLTREQITNILCCVLSRDDVPENLVEIVQEVSSGNAFWARSIADYISQFGFDSFMQSVGEKNISKIDITVESKVPNGEDLTSKSEDEANENNTTRSRSTTKQSNYAISHSFRKYGTQLFTDKNLLKQVARDEIELESSHLRNYIVSLVDQLSVSDTTILKFASISGVSFCSKVLSQVLPQNLLKNNMLESSLSSLEEKGFLVRVSSEGTIYRFQNHRFREIIYDFTPPSDASRIHYAIAKTIERIYANVLHLSYEGLTYHYNNAIETDTTSTVYKEALKYSLLTSSQFILLGNFSSALDYLEYAEEIACTTEEYQQILNILKSAESIANVKFSEEFKIDQQILQNTPIHEHTDHDLHHDLQNIDDPNDIHNKPQIASSEVVASLFYQHATLGGNGEGYIFDDFVNLHHRLKQKISQLEEKQGSSATTTKIALIPGTQNHQSHNITNSTLTDSMPISVSNTSKSTSTPSKSNSLCIIS